MDDDHRDKIERACTRLINEFALFNDSGDMDRLSDLFTTDATFARPLDPDNPIVGKEAIMAMFRNRPPRFSRHFMSNIVIDVISEDEAHGVCYVTFLSTTDVDAPRPVACEPKMYMGEYRDVFRRGADGWKFAARRGCMSLVLNT